MTDNTSTDTSTDTQDAIDAGVLLAEPTRLIEGQKFAFPLPYGASVEIVDNDLDAYRDHPRRKTGTATVMDADTFIAYLAKHGLPETEVWANPTTAHLVAVINAHGPTVDADDDGWPYGVPGWGDHRAQLNLIPTKAWDAWARYDRKLIGQVDFAEHVEDHLTDFVIPHGADMLELAQTFSANRSVRFESSRRVRSGETQLVYKEDETAAAGRKGQIAIPDTFTLALRPYEGSDVYKVTARLRYRISNEGLRLGYVLDNPEDILRSAFVDIVSAIGAGITQHVWTGTPTT